MNVLLLDVADINVAEDRKRKEFLDKDLNELRDGIAQVGLINPITVEVRDDGEYWLVAGERRLKTICAMGSYEFGGQIIQAGNIPCVDVGEIELLKARRIELYENSQRVGFTWQERDAAVAAVEELLKMEEVEDLPVTLENITKTLLKKDDVTYREKEDVNKALRRLEHADNPLVQKAKSAKDADKIIEKQLKDEHKARMAEQFKEIESPHVVVFGDSVEHCRGYKEETFDIIVSDPIYGINMHEQNAFQRVQMQEGKLHGYDDSYENWKRMFDEMPQTLYHIAKDEAACYLFCDITRFFELKDLMSAAGWDVWNRPIIWYKGNIGSLPRPEHGPRYTYEVILFAIKGDKKTNGVFHDVINIPQTTGHVHGAGKPVELYEELLKRCAVPGDLVLDFCAGSFPILPACNRRSLRCHAIELDTKWEDEAELRKCQDLK